MLRKVLGVGAGTLVLLGTICVLWAGLNWPPPLWILRYGMPGSQHPTGKTITVEGVTFVMISPGYFQMGSDWFASHPEDRWALRCTHGDVLGRLCYTIGLSWGDALRPSSEMPTHWVEFRQSFGIAKTEITNAQYTRFDSTHDRLWPHTYQLPLVDISWQDARKYCAWLSKRSGLRIHLPSESEWECACRAGASSEYYSGDDSSRLGKYAWYAKNAPIAPREVATKKANAWGLFDMEGNVWEWCQDRWHNSYLLTRKVKEKDGSVATVVVDRAPDDGSAWERGHSHLRVMRGGAWSFPAGHCRCATRSGEVPVYRRAENGFRPVLSLP